MDHISKIVCTHFRTIVGILHRAVIIYDDASAEWTGCNADGF